MAPFFKSGCLKPRNVLTQGVWPTSSPCSPAPRKKGGKFFSKSPVLPPPLFWGILAPKISIRLCGPFVPNGVLAVSPKLFFCELASPGFLAGSFGKEPNIAGDALLAQENRLKLFRGFLAPWLQPGGEIPGRFNPKFSRVTNSRPKSGLVPNPSHTCATCLPGCPGSQAEIIKALWFGNKW